MKYEPDKLINHPKCSMSCKDCDGNPEIERGELYFCHTCNCYIF